jgi:NAD(P)H-hydrate epimerase
VTYTQDELQAVDGPTAAEALETYLRSHDAMVLGPGLGRGQQITAFVEELLERRPPDHRLVVDADGLFALADIAQWHRLLGPNAILTPHSGELERLVGHELDQEEPMWAQAARLAKDWNCVLVAKGPFTCVADPSGQVDVWPRANPALATGGTGDVLAGVTAGLLAQHLRPWDAARLAVGMHGIAGERVVADRKWRTLLASDLFQELPAVAGHLASIKPTQRR